MADVDLRQEREPVAECLELIACLTMIEDRLRALWPELVHHDALLAGRVARATRYVHSAVVACDRSAVL